MRRDVLRRSVLFAGLAGLASACGGRDLGRLPAADQVLVSKSERRMWLLRAGQSLRQYPVELGFQPAGHKTVEGDGRTPEGLYFIDRKNPRSDFHLSLGINYPNRADVARAEAAGVNPGG
ncbi:MAG: L,D-transpeptidase family protein, partial [Pseudomonadota bacterium]